MLLGGEESFQGGETARLGSNIVENVRFGRPRPFPGPSRPMPTPGPSFWTLLAWSWDPKMRAGNLLAQPIGPNPTVLPTDDVPVLLAQSRPGPALPCQDLHCMEEHRAPFDRPEDNHRLGLIKPLSHTEVTSTYNGEGHSEKLKFRTLVRHGWDSLLNKTPRKLF